MCLILFANIFAITADEIIRRLDENNVGVTQEYGGVMTIVKGQRTLVKEFKGYAESNEETFFMEFTNPEDRGVKYLKRSDELWIYFPDADDVMKIAGSMLKQGMMGSDLSYEDMVRMEELNKKYDSSILAEEKFGESECYKVEIKAKEGVKDVTYYREIIWVDKGNFVMRKAELYAKSGRLLKTMETENVKKIGERFVPTKIVIKDMKRKDSVTTMEFTRIEFDVKVPEGVFTMEYLQR